MPVEIVDGDAHVRPAGPMRGTATPPGSKSLTNRFLTCMALARGVSTLRGVSPSDDTRAMVAGLTELGFRIDTPPSQTLVIHGLGGNVPAEDAFIDVGHAGTAMRFMTALSCLGFGRRRLDGSARMRQRPIGDLVGALQAMGAQIGYDGQAGYPPLSILARGLVGGALTLRDTPSSQFLSALLMVAPCATHDVMIRIEGDLPSRPYVAMTADVMRAMGVDLVDHEDRCYIVPALQTYRPTTADVEPDASGATYLWAAAAITGGRVRVGSLTRRSRQGDVRFVEVLERVGCRVEADEAGITVAAPRDRVLHGVDVDLNAMPDTVQTLAVVALFAAEPTTIRNVANLRVKETDRLAALAAELSRLGAGVEVFDDGLRITPPARIAAARVRTYDDHRMAMSFALAGLAVNGIVVENADCVSKSFPGYFEVLASLHGRGASADEGEGA